MGKVVGIEDSTELPCSGCDGKATFTAEGERPTFFHTMPYCARFDQVDSVVDLIEYFRECAEKAHRKRMS